MPDYAAVGTFGTGTSFQSHHRPPGGALFAPADASPRRQHDALLRLITDDARRSGLRVRGERELRRAFTHVLPQEVLGPEAVGPGHAGARGPGAPLNWPRLRCSCHRARPLPSHAVLRTYEL